MILSFTFQYGDIQILYQVLSEIDILQFTFQSGDIQIQQDLALAATQLNLHSNLVIFKLKNYHLQWTEQKHLHSNLVIFKFNYEIKLVEYKELFTFQSGDIQI